MTIKTSIILPFNVKANSEVTGGYADKLHTEFGQETEITNYHEDDYRVTDKSELIYDAVIQGPFTQTWVGGRSHRHIPLNFGDDTAQTRPEGWHVQLLPNTVRLYSHAYLNSPPAYWTREEFAKRPVNIKNIDNTEKLLGNFSENYQILQTSGRRITNNLIVDGFVASSPLTTQFISGANEYSLPDLTLGTGSKSVIVERFSAPGSKEENSRGALDREGEEMSPNIPLSFRNIKIRQRFYRQLSQHMPQFASGSTFALLPATGEIEAVTIHKVNRNRLVRAGNVQYDNWFVQHQIPRTDIQYSWITASATTTAEDLGGYQYLEYVGRQKISSGIDFISGSFVVSGSSQEYFVDNLFINSLVKDNKQINIETNTYSVSASLSASVAEYTSSPYTFTTWVSLRTGETPVARSLKKQNIISIQDKPKPITYKGFRNRIITVVAKKSDTSSNYKEPPVTFKYRPLEHVIKLNEEATSIFKIKHEYTNLLSKFANKDLNKKLLLQENGKQFYDFLLNKIKVEDTELRYLGHTYKEIIWPREENTGLKETRKRNEYYLDKPGFDRDGFDIQLGTQRVFWRNKQQDRKRSKNSEGGYYSSINYLSTEETGSNFSFNESGLSPDNNSISYNLNFSISGTIDNGIFNSVTSLEKSSEEKQIAIFEGNVQNIYSTNKVYLNNLASINSRTFLFDSSGEFNSLYNDFYEEIVDKNLSYKKSIGAVYRNTSYKSLLTALPKERAEITDIVAKTQDEEIFVNPKLKYVAFVGGTELNTGSYIQNEANFSNITSSALGIPDQLLTAIHISGSDIYVGDVNLATIDGESFPKVAKYNRALNQWEALGTGPTSLSSIEAIQHSGSDIYVGGNGGTDLYYWDGASWTAVTSPGGTQINALALYDGHIYAGTNSELTRYDNPGWTPISSPGVVNEIKVHNNKLYYSGGTPLVGFVRSYDGINDTNLGNPGPRVRALTFSGSDIFAGGKLSSGPAYIKKWQGGTSWSNFTTTFTVNEIWAMEVVNNKLYAAGGTSISPNKSLISRYDILTGLLDSTGPSCYSDLIKNMVASGSDIHYVGNFYYPYSYLASYSTEKEQKFYINNNPFTFSENYFSQSFSEEQFSFSTMDNGLKNAKEEQANKKPFYDSYEDFIEDVRPLAKEYSILPEFRISEHMKYYVSDNVSNFRAKNRSFLSLDGTRGNHRSAETELSSYDSEFLKTYASSDLLKKHDSLQKENEEISEINTIELKVSGIKKLLPYNGFYPQERTVQLANLYEQYVSSSLHGGIYNLSYENEIIEDVVVDTQNTGSISSISVAKFGNNYYMATGKTNLDGASTPYGNVSIYKTNGEDIQDWEQTPVAQFSYNKFIYTLYGSNVQLLSASNGLNLFFHTANSGATDNSEGYIFHATSSDGTTWSQPDKMQVHATSEYITGSSNEQKFGYYFDLLYENKSSQEKIFLAIGSYLADLSFTDNGLMYVVTGALNNNQWEWSNKTTIDQGSANSNELGTGVSILSCSSGYQIFYGETEGDSPSSNNGNIKVITSTDGISWSAGSIIASGTVNLNIGYNNIKSQNFNDKSYVFFSEPGTGNSSGNVYVISSSASNQWLTTYSEKTRLYTTEIEGDNALNEDRSFSIDAKVANNVLYYSFSNYIEVRTAGIEQNPGSFIVGKTSDGQSWEKLEDNNIFIKDVPNDDYGNVSAFRTIKTFIDETSVGQKIYTFSDIHDKDTDNSKVIMIGYNPIVRYALDTTNTEKYYKHAALEPFFAPGILYNTIKSGLAVDWPCTTGSNTAIVPYGNNTIVNAYYPKSIQMANFSGSNIYETAYGHLRSNIDYRIPFENILFPNEAFIEKQYQEEDLVSKTFSSTLNDDDPLVQFIDKTYIYGGYEPYISPIDFSDVGNYGPKRFSVPFVYRKKGSTNNGLYTLAMSNFLAETVKFFLKDEKMLTFSSEPDYKWKQFDSNKTYYMDIILEKTPELVMMEAYHSILHPTGSNGEKMNGRYFGYPVNKTDKAIWGGAEFTQEERKLIHNDPAYAPYTPPYFEGVAKARISFKPSGTSRSYTVQEIFDEAIIENIFDDVAKGATTESDAYINKMPINSSFEIFGSAQATEVTIDETTDQQTIRELTDAQKWIISPRMETPVLDFSAQTLEPYQNDYSKTSGFGRGMWSGYGSIPTEGKGIKVRLAYPYAQERASPLTASLLEHVGFKAEEQNVGQIADSKTISEAIVLVPYLEKKNSQYTVLNSTGFNFIKISKNVFNKVKKGQIESESISDMLEKMEKYVIPPEMNFLEYADIYPFVMYFFEFEYILTQQDLADVWQGVMPEISKNAEQDEISIIHNCDRYEFFEGKEIPDNLRWLVFKVKQKAEKNYFNITTTTKDDQRFKFDKRSGRKVGTDVYSYNWPYDYFSLVEMAKIELNLEYKAKDSE